MALERVLVVKTDNGFYVEMSTEKVGLKAINCNDLKGVVAVLYAAFGIARMTKDQKEFLKESIEKAAKGKDKK